MRSGNESSQRKFSEHPLIPSDLRARSINRNKQSSTKHATSLINSE